MIFYVEHLTKYNEKEFLILCLLMLVVHLSLQHYTCVCNSKEHVGSTVHRVTWLKSCFHFCVSDGNGWHQGTKYLSFPHCMLHVQPSL